MEARPSDEREIELKKPVFEKYCVKMEEEQEGGLRRREFALAL